MVGFNPRRSNFQRGALVYALGHFFLLKWGASLQSKLGKRREAMAPTFTLAMRWHCFPGGRAVVQPEEKSCSFLRLPTAPVGSGCAEDLPRKCHPLGVPASSLCLGGWSSALGYSQIKVAPGASRFQAMNPVCTEGCLHPPAGG